MYALRVSASTAVNSTDSMSEYSGRSTSSSTASSTSSSDSDSDVDYHRMMHWLSTETDSGHVRMGKAKRRRLRQNQRAQWAAERWQQGYSSLATDEEAATDDVWMATTTDAGEDTDYHNRLAGPTASLFYDFTRYSASKTWITSARRDIPPPPQAWIDIIQLLGRCKRPDGASSAGSVARFNEHKNYQRLKRQAGELSSSSSSAYSSNNSGRSTPEPPLKDSWLIQFD